MGSGELRMSDLYTEQEYKYKAKDLDKLVNSVVELANINKDLAYAIVTNVYKRGHEHGAETERRRIK